MRSIFIVMLLVIAQARASCHRPDAVLTDRGLDRVWAIEQNCAHPERPPRLVELLRNDAGPQAQGPLAGGSQRPVKPESVAHIRAGDRVTLDRRGTDASVHLTGVALSAGAMGQTIAVKAGLGAVPLEGVVVGPGYVELKPARGRR
jgi:Chaperone for flagella basal body P-ring formation